MSEIAMSKYCKNFSPCALPAVAEHDPLVPEIRLGPGHVGEALKIRNETHNLM